MPGTNLDPYLRICRVLLDTGLAVTPEEAASNQAIPPTLRQEIERILEAERVIHIRDPHMVEDPDRRHTEWLHLIDRQDWYYWPRLREHLIDCRDWNEVVVRSIDRASDRILGAMENPNAEDPFRTQGLVVGYVQSGKTANYSSLIAKAADCGYRLVIVLTGIHNSLRQQTQRRLTAELVGIDDGVQVGVGGARPDRQWHTFTSSKLNGDFNPGNANAAALVDPNRVLIVAKKRTSILRSMNEWFNLAPPGVLATIPTIIIDDEADQASVNTGGDRPPDAGDEGDAVAPDETAPSQTNALIRSLVQRFQRVAYVAYTATPFANVLIDHEAVDLEHGEDLYPRSFIMDLPKPPGYWGADRIFGLSDEGQIDAADDAAGLNVLRTVPDEDIPSLVPGRRAEVPTFEPEIPESLTEAIDAFILSGAAMTLRDRGHGPATMLIHTTYSTRIQRRLTQLVEEVIDGLRDEWRYMRERGLQRRLEALWERDFRPVIRAMDHQLDARFSDLSRGPIGIFLEQLQVRQINSGSIDELDYEREPDLKVVVIGGNRLSRGLTLNGLLVSYYVRAARNYDTLMQMGRWFGFRDGYADLTRIYTTAQLERWFRDLATVEMEVREDIRRYELERLTPLEFGVRIRAHPAMLVTSPLKMQHAELRDLSFSNTFRQTINFQFNDHEWLDGNLEVTRGFLSSMGPAHRLWKPGQPMWAEVSWKTVIDYLEEYQLDPFATQMKADPVRRYVRRQAHHGEIVRWVVAVMGQQRQDRSLGEPLDFGIMAEGGAQLINPIERTRLRNTGTLKAIASLPDQGVGLSDQQFAMAMSVERGKGAALRAARPATEGLLLIYPISRYSGYAQRVANDPSSERVPIFDDPEAGVDVIGIAMVFPPSQSAAAEEYYAGTVGPLEQ